MLAALGVLAAVGMSACAATRTPSSAPPGNGQTTTPAATVAANPASSPAAATPSATPAGAGTVQNLVITSAEKSELTAAYVAFRAISLSDVAGEGPTPGSVYYAYDPATDTYWALADFQPSGTASLDVQVGFQDGGGIAMFQKAGSEAWQTTSAGEPQFCAEAKFFPPAVLTAWSMSAPPGLGC